MMVCRLLFFGAIALLAMSAEAGPETAVREALAARPLERPGLFATSNEFAAVRARLAGDAVLSNALERVRRNAVRAMRSRPIEHRLSGRRMLGESREALSRILNGVVAWRVLGEPTGRDVAVRTLDEVTAFPDWNPSKPSKPRKRGMVDYSTDLQRGVVARDRGGAADGVSAD